MFESPDGKLMAAEVREIPQFEIGEPRVLFKLPQGSSWTNAHDAQRFLLTVPPADEASATPTVVLNWQATLKH